MLDRDRVAKRAEQHLRLIPGETSGQSEPPQPLDVALAGGLEDRGLQSTRSSR